MTHDPHHAVRDAFASLPAAHRLVLQLARNGHSYTDIAERLGVAPARVRALALHGMLALTSARSAASASTPG